MRLDTHPQYPTSNFQANPWVDHQSEVIRVDDHTLKIGLIGMAQRELVHRQDDRNPLPHRHHHHLVMERVRTNQRVKLNEDDGYSSVVPQST
jgi:hypothetical protein